jgi:glycolate oxidase
MFSLGFDQDAGALVLAQSDAGPVQAQHDIDLLSKLFADAGATEVVVAEDTQEGELLLAARRQVLVAFERMGTTLIDDVCVPRDRLAELVERVEAVAASAGVLVAVVGHAGDGNFHPSVVFDDSDPAQVSAAKQAFDDIMLVGLDLGGTITGEHGVGTLKKDLLRREAGDLSLRVHRDIKRALDPQGILNPGKVFDL